MKSWDVTFTYRWRVEAKTRKLAEGVANDHFRDQWFEKDDEKLVPPDMVDIRVDRVHEGQKVPNFCRFDGKIYSSKDCKELECKYLDEHSECKLNQL